jgi:tetratricopeptide (TPR) repeat protein
MLAGVGIWWQWDHIIRLPGIEPLVARVTEKPLPRAVPGKFNIAVAHLEGDDKRETERLIRESLAEFTSVATLSFDRLITTGQGDSETSEREGHERARTLLEASGVDVLIWGVVLKQGGRILPKLYWTPARDVAHVPSAGRYQTTEDLSLPSIFWLDLTNVLGLLVATTEAELGSQDGQYHADKLESFIQRVRGPLRNSRAEQWNPAARSKVLSIMGNALATYGDQSGTNEPLLEAIAVHREALKYHPRGDVPLSWAATQHNLGVALVTLGQREADPLRLNEAMAAYRSALQERTREKVPLNWAATQNNLVAHSGYWGSGSRTRRGSTRRWSPFGRRCRNAGARMHRSPGRRRRTTWGMRCWPWDSGSRARNGSTRRWPRFGRRCRNARAKVPLDWAATQNSIGLALAALGQLESDPSQLNEAVLAYRDALQERTRAKAPFDWAITQINLGNAFGSLGQRESDPAPLREAARAYEGALLVLRPAQVDYYVKIAERNLQRVQKEIVQRTNAKGKSVAR